MPSRKKEFRRRNSRAERGRKIDIFLFERVRILAERFLSNRRNFLFDKKKPEQYASGFLWLVLFYLRESNIGMYQVYLYGIRKHSQTRAAPAGSRTHGYGQIAGLFLYFIIF